MIEWVEGALYETRDGSIVRYMKETTNKTYPVTPDSLSSLSTAIVPASDTLNAMLGIK